MADGPVVRPIFKRTSTAYSTLLKGVCGMVETGPHNSDPFRETGAELHGHAEGRRDPRYL